MGRSDTPTNMLAWGQAQSLKTLPNLRLCSVTIPLLAFKQESWG